MQPTPPLRIKTQAALAAVVVALEHETARRYRELAAVMHRRGHDEVAEVFARLVVEAAEREAAPEHWGVKPGEALPPATFADGHLRAILRDRTDEPDADVITPYRALATAVRREENIFHFFSLVAANTDDAKVHARAEALATQTLGRAAALRRARRRAYHERRRHPSLELPAPALVQDPADMLFAAAMIEDAAATDLMAAAHTHPELRALAEKTRDSAQALKDASLEAGEPNPALTEALRQAAKRGNEEDGRATRPASARRALADAKRAFTFYDTLVTDATSEDVLLEAQRLSDQALERIQALSRVHGNDSSTLESNSF